MACGRQRLPLDLAFGNRREIVAGRPDPGREFLPEGENAGLEGLERHLPVAEILVSDLVEIVAARPRPEARPPTNP
jgi:hypothetical protein